MMVDFPLGHLLNDEIEMPCGGNNGHQQKVIVYSRTEDEKNVVITIVDQYKGEVDSYTASSKQCPSPRRQSLEIVFSCENCEKNHVLVLSQHKGMTFIGWSE